MIMSLEQHLHKTFYINLDTMYYNTCILIPFEKQLSGGRNQIQKHQNPLPFES